MFDARGARWRAGGLAAVGVAALATVGFTKTSSLHHARTFGAAIGGAIAPPSAAVNSLVDLSDAFASVAAQVRPSVVYIVAKHTEQVASRSQHGQQRRPQMLPPDIMPFFRGMPGMPDGGDMPDMPHGDAVASGSGFIVSPDGYILTNNHVVDGATHGDRPVARSTASSRRTSIGADPTTDVAVVKINATGPGRRAARQQ